MDMLKALTDTNIISDQEDAFETQQVNFHSRMFLVTQTNLKEQNHLSNSIIT